MATGAYLKMEKRFNNNSTMLFNSLHNAGWLRHCKIPYIGRQSNMEYSSKLTKSKQAKYTKLRPKNRENTFNAQLPIWIHRSGHQMMNKHWPKNGDKSLNREENLSKIKLKGIDLIPKFRLNYLGSYGECKHKYGKEVCRMAKCHLMNWIGILIIYYWIWKFTGKKNKMDGILADTKNAD